MVILEDEQLAGITPLQNLQMEDFFSWCRRNDYEDVVDAPVIEQGRAPFLRPLDLGRLKGAVRQYVDQQKQIEVGEM